MTAILFIASCAEYDEFIREDLTTNRLDETRKVFETLINYKYLQNVEFILFLNKHDLLKEKINKIDIKQFCPDFKGNSNSISDIENYLIKKFTVFESNDNTNQNSLHNKPLTRSNNLGQYTNTNTNRNNVYNNRDQFSIISQHENANFKNSEKAIYSHFTTAIDTNNIKTIFEMVRLMIFEKNCKAIMLN